MADSSGSNKGMVAVGVAAGIGLLAAILGTKPKAKPPGLGAPRLRKSGCNCGR